MLFYLTVLEICPPPHTHTLSDPPLKTFPHPLPAPPQKSPTVWSNPFQLSYDYRLPCPTKKTYCTF